MSWNDIMRRMLTPIGGFEPHTTSPFGAIREGKGTSPHVGVDTNYNVGQHGINLTNPAVRSPVDGVVTNGGEGSFGRISIRDKNGNLHDLLHTHRQHVRIGDPVAAGQIIGSMGNTGTRDHHVHYQLRDSSGRLLDPQAYWDQQGPMDPNPAPPVYIPEYQQYLREAAKTSATPVPPDQFRVLRRRPEMKPDQPVPSYEGAPQAAPSSDRFLPQPGGPVNDRYWPGDRGATTAYNEPQGGTDATFDTLNDWYAWWRGRAGLPRSW